MAWVGWVGVLFVLLDMVCIEQKVHGYVNSHGLFGHRVFVKKRKMSCPR